jgi:hypothetical protein
MVDDVITFKQYMFITIRGSGVISVPQRAFANQAGFQQFIAEVKMDWQKGKTKFAE